MNVMVKNFMLTTGIAALSLFAPTAASAQSNDWYNGKKTNSNISRQPLKTASELKKVDAKESRAMQKNDNLMNSLQVTGMADRGKVDTHAFGRDETEFLWVKRRLLGISKGTELTAGLKERIANYLIQDTTLYKALIEESLVANKYVWLQQLGIGDRVQVLSYKEMLPGTVDWRPNILGQNAFEVIIDEENRLIIAHELADDIRYTGKGPIKAVWYPSDIMECKLNGTYMFDIFAETARLLQIKLRSIDLQTEQRKVLEQKYASQEQFMR